MRISLVFLLSFVPWACKAQGQKSIPGPDWQRVPVSIELRLADLAPAPGLTPATVHGRGDTVYLSSRVELSGEQVARAQALEVPPGLVLRLWLTEEGRNRMAALKAAHIGGHLAVLINSVVVAEPAVIAPPPISVDTTPPTHEIPVFVAVPLPQGEARQLAKAVSQTWPARAGP